LKVQNLKSSARFYAAALAPLRYVVDSSGSGFGPADAPALWLHESATLKCIGSHIALRATNRNAVDRFYREGLLAGGRDNGKPGLRTDYSPRYYAAFLLDP
jgi:hypothetical protein